MKAIASILLPILLLASLQACGGPVTSGGTEDVIKTGGDTGNTTENENIRILDFSGNVANGSTFTTIEIHDTPDDISSLIIKFDYDLSILKVFSIKDRDLFLDSYGFKLTTELTSYVGISTQILKFSTVDGSYLPQGSSGVVATVVFEVLRDRNTALSLRQTEFDESHPDWTKKDGHFTISE